MRVSEIAIEKWTELCELSQKSGSVFISQPWLELCLPEIKVFAIYDKNEKIIGAFSVYVRRMGLARYYRNAPFSPHCGLFFRNDAVNPASRNSSTKSTIDAVAGFLREQPYTLMSLAFPSDIIDMQPFYWRKFKVIPNYTYQISLRQTEEQIFANMASERRNDIKKALRDGVESMPCSDGDVIAGLIQKTFQRKNKSTDIARVRKIIDAFLQNGNGYAFVSYWNGKPAAVSFVVYDVSNAYYLLGGYDDTNNHNGAGALSLWNAIKHAQQLNLDIFDFEGSMLTEVEKYFRAFGGQIVPYFTVNRAGFLTEILLKYFKRTSF
ncbi:MAG: GNAT family N-acetyltransferase [Bacteroidetes bacterium]|nr:GNAT family N-acetyltransferase [Bacteroidota bacterium]